MICVAASSCSAASPSSGSSPNARLPRAAKSKLKRLHSSGTIASEDFASDDDSQDEEYRVEERPQKIQKYVKPARCSQTRPCLVLSPIHHPGVHYRQGPEDTHLRREVEAYWRRKGVTNKARLGKLVSMAGNRRLYGDFVQLDAKLAQLSYVLPGADIAKVVSNAPKLLVYDIDDSIPKKLQQLKKLLPGVDVIKVVANTPHLLTFDIENNVAHKVEQLRKLLPGANVVKIVCAAPNLLSYDIETSLQVKLDLLHKLLPGADVAKLVSYAPTLLYHDIEASVATKLRHLKNLLPGRDVVKVVCAAPNLLCSDIEGSVTRKLLWVRLVVDGTTSNINNVIESNPRLLLCGFGVVFGRLEFVRNVRNSYVPVNILRSILLTPVEKFEGGHPGYKQYLAQQLENAKWQNKSYAVWIDSSVKKLESEYGNCLRAVANKA